MQLWRLFFLLFLAVSALLFAEVAHASDMEIEIEAEAEEDDNDQGQQATQQSRNQQKVLVWDAKAMSEAGVVRLSNELYDREVYTAASDDKLWLIVFTKELKDENPYGRMRNINEQLAKLLLDFKKTKQGKRVQVAYVDSHDDGETLKETFDIEVVPSVRLVAGDKVHHLKWGSGLWSLDELTAFVTNYAETPWDYKRARVSDGILLSIEYVFNTIADNHFSSAMENYMTARKFVHEWTGYKHDFKTLNPNWGKKNTFKKSQMRTLVYYLVLPGTVVGTVVILTSLMCFITCLQRICCPVPASETQEGSKVKSE